MADEPQVTLRDVVAIGKRYAKLGWAVHAQLDGLLGIGDEHKSTEECNANALIAIRKFIDACGVTEFDDDGLRDDIDHQLESAAHDKAGRWLDG